MRSILAVAMLGVAVAVTGSVAVAASSQPVVPGTVEQKFTSSGDDAQFLISVDGVPYSVPMDFWYAVQVGDTVGYMASRWEVVRTARGQTPQREVGRETSPRSPVTQVAGPTPVTPYGTMRELNKER